VGSRDDLRDFVEKVALQLKDFRGKELSIPQWQGVLGLAEQCSRILRNLDGLPDRMPDDPQAKSATDAELMEALSGSSTENQ
jgi:hypothetical protein